MKDEDELVDDAIKGDGYSFEILLRPYRQGLLTVAYRMTGDVEEAKEVCQEALIKTYRYLHKFKKGRSFKSWIYAITINSAFDFLKKRKKHENLVKSQKHIVMISSSDPEKRFLDKEIKEKIETCLRALSPKERIIFQLRDGEGFSIKETSRILDCSSLSVRIHVTQARKKIRAQLEKMNLINHRGKAVR